MLFSYPTLARSQVQGRTVEKVILDLNQVPLGLASLTFSHFYVGFSRVRSNKDLRVLPPKDPNKGFAHLLRLRVDPYLRAWCAGVDPATGRWDAARVRAYWQQNTGGSVPAQPADATPPPPQQPAVQVRPTAPQGTEPPLREVETQSSPSTPAPAASAFDQTHSWFYVPLLRQVSGFEAGNRAQSVVLAFDAQYGESSWQRLVDAYKELYSYLGTTVPWVDNVPGSCVEADAQVPLLDPYDLTAGVDLPDRLVPTVASLTEYWNKVQSFVLARHAELR